jgi:formiminoglutamase
MTSPPDMSVWQGRDDTADEGPNALRVHQCIKRWTQETPAALCLLGFCCDEGVRRNQGRVGAARGPMAIRKAIANLAWSSEIAIADVGDLSCHGGDLESAQGDLADAVSSLVTHGHRAIVLGGGHETAWGSFCGLTKAFPDSSIGIINFDAHFDLRQNSTAHSGTPFRQMAEWHRDNGRKFHYLCLGIAEPSNTQALFQAAAEFGVAWKSDRELVPWKLEPILDQVRRFIDAVDLVYLSVDFDVLPGSLMSAVSASAGAGVPMETLEALIEQIAATDKLAVADFVEFNPTFDLDRLAAKTAARLVWRLAKCWSTRPKGVRS